LIALGCALNQDYDSGYMEIVIFDDEDEPAFPSFTDPPALPCKPLIRYFRLPKFSTLGNKRNALCEESHGDIIVHVDSDDLSAPSRVSSQVHWLIQSGKAITGFHTLPFYDISTGRAYCYHLNSSTVCGTSLVYSREFWRRHPFPNADIGEDLTYASNKREHRLAVDSAGLLVALLHAGNTSSSKQVRNHPQLFPLIQPSTLPAWFMPYANQWHINPACGNVSEISKSASASASASTY